HPHKKFATGSKLTESKFLEGTTMCLWEEEVHEEDFKEKEDAVADIILPASVRDTNRVDELVEEPSSTAEPLEDRDALRTNFEWEELDQERCVISRSPRILGNGKGDELYVSAL
ncbi:hypothetical protein C0992_003770, partial [Termitomyces sp. T32_za158]